MPSSVKSRSPKKKQRAVKAKKTSAALCVDMNRLEFHRHGIALMPGEEDDDRAIVYCVQEKPGRIGTLYCSCKTAGRTTCNHLKKFPEIWRALEKTAGGLDRMTAFQDDAWHRFAAVMAEGARQPLKTMKFDGQKTDGMGIAIRDSAGNELVRYQANGGSRDRLLDRCTDSEDQPATRGAVLRKLTRLTVSDDERLLEAKGLKTRRQVFEEGFWHRFAYHCYREFGTQGYVLDTAVDAAGEFFLSVKSLKGRMLFTLSVPSFKVESVLEAFAEMPFAENCPRIGDLPLQTLLDVRLNEAMGLEIKPLLHRLDQNGMERFFDLNELQSSEYQDFYYFKDLQMLLKDRRPLRVLPDFIDQLPMTVPQSQVPRFLLEHARDLESDLYRVDQGIKKLKIMTEIERIEISPKALERDWYWLSVTYGHGRQSVSLQAILSAKQSGERFVAIDGGWVDTDAPVFDGLDQFRDDPASSKRRKNDEAVGLKRADVLRLGAVGGRVIKSEGSDQNNRRLNHLLDLAPLTPMPLLTGLKSTLRPYQQRGAEWLWFLYENGLGGILCDDMGLGKTHQIMALLLALQESGSLEKPALVVCPTSVIFHWQQKIAMHAPGLKVNIHYGSQRDMDQTTTDHHVIVTSYGVMRQDIRMLTKIPFSVAVFDEIQYIKNPATLSYKAARRVDADIRIGLTGTPIENSVGELKALMDLAVPGYLGSDRRFDRRYRVPIEQDGNTAARRMLRQLIAPFTLRRLKRNVLKDLPPKIEDCRICRLSEEQTSLYRQAINSKGEELVESLARTQTAAPYMHIFALLNLLKQICDHPALVAGDASAYADYASGKWDLFTELMAESLASGQKIVVYSQYLTMIEIITRYLTDQAVEFVTLTGGSRRRGRIVERFNQDPSCRVFVGSLKAGGVGIDLVAASVVIHYDRWWNAAKEDQATDRVHRIGQTRGVQVFKLVTQGTLEEKINAIIAKKRDLMESVVKEDNPDMVKIFSRKELMEMLAMPT